MSGNKEVFLNTLIFGIVVIGGFIWIGGKILKTSGAK